MRLAIRAFGIALVVTSIAMSARCADTDEDLAPLEMLTVTAFDAASEAPTSPPPAPRLVVRLLLGRAGVVGRSLQSEAFIRRLARISHPADATKPSRPR
jgi:hypothetical protein